jgi:hypothetical protein
MNLKQALEHLVNSEGFKNEAKEKTSKGAKYRMFLKRYNDGELKNGAAIDMLLEHGYEIDIKKPKQ